MDVLHLDINIVSPLFTIASRILHFGNDQFPTYTYVKTNAQKSDLEQSESLYLKSLLKFCPTIPDLTQMPGNFFRKFSSEENKDLILKPLPECEAKHKFAAVMDLWRRIRRTHKSSNPTAAAVDDYPNLVKQFLTLLDKDFPWFKPLPNQFHRLTHSSYFLNNDRNDRNYTTKIQSSS